VKPSIRFYLEKENYIYEAARRCQARDIVQWLWLGGPVRSAYNTGMPRRRAVLAALSAGVFVVGACHERPQQSSGDVPKIDVAALHLKFVTIPAGTFRMGAEWSRSPDQGPVHDVTISRPFDLQTAEVTQTQWVTVMGSNPSHFHGDDLPVEQVAATDVDELLRRLNGNDPGKNYRLPTEAEWEYACRAGSTDPRYGELETIAWFHDTSGNTTHAVGAKQPNAWGLYDMLGNVWELTADWKNNYPSGAVTDPKGPKTGYYRVSRGGSWFDVRAAVNATFRASPAPSDRTNSLGFRIARDASK
jgi:formylglycine-generating enzyme required for sulfatase activity